MGPLAESRRLTCESVWRRRNQDLGNPGLCPIDLHQKRCPEVRSGLLQRSIRKGVGIQGSRLRVRLGGFRVWGLGFGIQGFRLRVQGLGCEVQGSGIRIWGLGLEFGSRVYGFGVQDLGFRF